jgi:ubiquinone/menaquinone biosynthesis C-methylase UbiE
MSDVMERKPHVDVNMPLRALKARKIEELLDLASMHGGKLLEVGTGSGGIAHYFSHGARARWDVHAVDVVDNRQLMDGYRFELIEGCNLPFEDETFDVVISNHVIEHVGDAASQLLHMRELRRVLKSTGRGYLAVPNRWMFMEPHYRLAFLSWLPKGWRTGYLRAMGKGEAYDCEPLVLSQVERLLANAGVSYRNVCAEALRLTFEIEKPEAMVTRVLRKVPDAFLKSFRGLIPTLIYRFSR